MMSTVQTRQRLLSIYCSSQMLLTLKISFWLLEKGNENMEPFLIQQKSYIKGKQTDKIYRIQSSMRTYVF